MIFLEVLDPAVRTSALLANQGTARNTADFGAAIWRIVAEKVVLPRIVVGNNGGSRRTAVGNSSEYSVVFS